MTPEEKENYDKSKGKLQKKVSLNPQTMEVKEETINREENKNEK
jgi:hypothetical protein